MILRRLFISSLFLLLKIESKPIEYYASKYDHLDVDTILNNQRMVQYYAACLLSHGPCPPQGVEFKRILPEALQTNCLKCTEKQKTVTYRSIKRLQKEYPKVWQQLTALWDPENIYVRKFENSFEQQNAIGSVEIGNRFGDSSDDVTYPSPIAATSFTILTSTDISSSTTFLPSTTVTINTTNNPITNTSNITSKKPVSTSQIAQTTRFPYLEPARPRPPPTSLFGTLGSNIQATVSLGTDLVGGFVRSLGNIGSQVVQTGSKMANAVYSAVFPPRF